MARDWREYFIERFSDKALFAVEDDNLEVVVTDATGQSPTEIEIRLAGDGRLENIAFFHPDTRGWNRIEQSELGWDDPDSDLPFTPDDVATAEALLAIPLYQGWREKAFYLNGEHVKSCVRFSQHGLKDGTVYMENGGCLLGPFLAIRYSNWFAGHRMQAREIVVDPMIPVSPPESESLERRPAVESPAPSGDVEGRQTFETSPAVGWVGAILYLVLLLILLRWP